MPSTTSFVPAGSAVTIAPDSIVPGMFSLPAVDGSNLDLAITVNGGGPVWLSPVAGGAVGPNAPTSILVQAGSTVLLTANNATLQAAATNPLVQSANWGASTVVTALSYQKGTTAVIQRGTATARSVF